MKSSIRDFIEQRRQVLEGKVESPKIEFTPETLQEFMKTMIQEINKMNPLDQKKFDQEIEKDKRRAMLAVELGRAEEAATLRRKSSCTHTRDTRTGNATQKGAGEWTTGGQVHGNDSITLICLRCGDVWHFNATPQERDYANNAGLLGMAPPPPERLIAA